MPKIIAVDVDLTVVDTLTPWLKEIEDYTGLKVKNESGEYDLVPEMKQLMVQAGVPLIDPFKFWENPKLYDKLEPLPWSVTALQGLKNNGCEILFVSTCVPEHKVSKWRFLKKWFPFYDAFIDTREKHYVKYDVLIDDKLEHLRLGRMYNEYADHFRFTGVRPDGNFVSQLQFPEISSWGEINTKLGF